MKNGGALGNGLRDFFTMLAVCHTVMVEKGKGDDYKYSASSPDELALVMGAKEVGILYNRRTASTIGIRVQTGILQDYEEEDYDVLVEFPFDSTRKRMSLVVKNH
jgi:magnesium-transporting ATPase (P-type)